MEYWIYITALTAAGTLAGILVGAIPGLSATMAVAILVSLTYGWDVTTALAVIMGIYQGAVFGGSITACLINIPGAPSSVITTLDGYPMAKRGEGGVAIGWACTESFIGGLIGILALWIGTPLIARVAIGFAPQDYFMLAVFGILLVGSFAEGSFGKAMFTASLGVVMGLIGLDLITGMPRLAFGSDILVKGVDLVTAILGLFGLSEVLFQLYQNSSAQIIQKVGRLFPPMDQLIRCLPLTLRTSAIGILIGALPGVGGPIASTLAYDHAKRTVREPSRPFGEGAYEGVVASESANNAAIGGAIIPMLTLGIPGDAVTAVIIGAFQIHGLRPGPMLMAETPHLFNLIVLSLLFATFFFLIFGFLLIKPFIKLVSIPQNILLPPIIFVTVIGAYAINSSMIDVAWMSFFGLLGFVFKLYKFPIPPMVLGLVLGPLIDETFRRTMISYHGNPIDIIGAIVASPISLSVVALMGVTFFLMLRKPRKAKA
jgi:putative tricarboxylic transport membrane protein